MRRESHVRFWEGVGVRFLRATRLIVLDEAHLRRVLARYFDYYNGTRCHLSLDGDTPASRAVQGPEQGRVVAFPEVGGLHLSIRTDGGVMSARASAGRWDRVIGNHSPEERGWSDFAASLDEADLAGGRVEPARREQGSQLLRDVVTLPRGHRASWFTPREREPDQMLVAVSSLRIAGRAVTRLQAGRP